MKQRYLISKSILRCFWSSGAEKKTKNPCSEFSLFAWAGEAVFSLVSMASATSAAASATTAAAAASLKWKAIQNKNKKMKKKIAINKDSQALRRQHPSFMKFQNM